MKSSLKAAFAGLGLAIGALLCAGGASAQYYSEPSYRGGQDRQGYDRQGYDRQGYDRPGYDRPGYDRGDRGRYDNRRDYDRYDQRRDERRPDRAYDRGYDQGRRDSRDRNNGMPPGWNQMSIEQQKQALKNQRNAQKKALKRGYVIP